MSPRITLDFENVAIGALEEYARNIREAPRLGGEVEVYLGSVRSNGARAPLTFDRASVSATDGCLAMLLDETLIRTISGWWGPDSTVEVTFEQIPLGLWQELVDYVTKHDGVSLDSGSLGSGKGAGAERVTLRSESHSAEGFGWFLNEMLGRYWFSGTSSIDSVNL